MKTARLFFAGLLIWNLVVLTAPAQLMPQDNWYFTGMSINGNFNDMAVGPDGYLYAITNGSAVAVYKTDGTFLRKFGTNMNIVGIGVSSSTNIYVLDINGTNHVKKFSATGQLLLSFGSDGTNDSQIKPTSGYSKLAVGVNDSIYIVDSGNYRIQEYDANGNQITHWGQNSSGVYGVPFKFSQLGGITALPNGDICIANYYPNSYNLDAELQLFSSNGDFIKLVKIATFIYSDWNDLHNIASAPDGLIWEHVAGFINVAAGGVGSGFSIAGPSPFGFSTSLPGGGSTPIVVAFDRRGTMYIATQSGGGIMAARRLYGASYGAAGAATPTLATPQPYISAVAQRNNTTLVDIDYVVVDHDTNSVTTALIAFSNNGNDLSSLKKPTVFIGGTATNIGLAMPTNVKLHVTWDAFEAATNFASFQFRISASDGRGLVAFNFVTVPTLQTNAAFTMNRSPVSDSDLLNVWFWLIATSDSSIVLTNGTVVGVGGAYNGQALASGTSTTAQGRAFLYQRLNVRAPTANEILRAQSGRYGFSSITANNVVKLP